MKVKHHAFISQVIMLGNPGYISLAGLWFIVPGLTTWRPVDAFLNG
jgi:hypothetical protein